MTAARTTRSTRVTRVTRVTKAVRAAVALVALAVAGCGGSRAPTLALPPRPSDALGGDAVMAGVADMSLEAREARLFAEIERGNVPDWVRTLRRVDVDRALDGRMRSVTFWVTLDYLAVGADQDFFRIPLSPQTAQRVADLTATSLPTTAIVDAVWLAATTRLEPRPIPPSDSMTTVPVFAEHERLVRDQLLGRGPIDGVRAGHKKDVVLAAALDSLAGRVAIYGWHRQDGDAIQPLYAGHTDRWVDYSHGIRLVARRMLVDGVEHDVSELLSDPRLAALLSDEGVILTPRYKTSGR